MKRRVSVKYRQNYLAAASSSFGKQAANQFGAHTMVAIIRKNRDIDPVYCVLAAIDQYSTDRLTGLQNDIVFCCRIVKSVALLLSVVLNFNEHLGLYRVPS